MGRTTVVIMPMSRIDELKKRSSYRLECVDVNEVIARKLDKNRIKTGLVPSEDTWLLPECQTAEGLVRYHTQRIDKGSIQTMEQKVYGSNRKIYYLLYRKGQLRQVAVAYEIGRMLSKEGFKVQGMSSTKSHLQLAGKDPVDKPAQGGSLKLF